MPVTIEKLSNEPILVVHLRDPLNLGMDIPHFAAALRGVLDTSPELLYVIADADAALDLSDIAGGLAGIALAELTIRRHPKVAGYCVVASNSQVGSRLSPSPDNGRQPVSVCETLNEALSVAHSFMMEKTALMP